MTARVAICHRLRNGDTLTTKQLCESLPTRPAVSKGFLNNTIQTEASVMAKGPHPVLKIELVPGRLVKADGRLCYKNHKTLYFYLQAPAILVDFGSGYTTTKETCSRTTSQCRKCCTFGPGCCETQQPQIIRCGALRPRQRPVYYFSMHSYGDVGRRVLSVIFFQLHSRRRGAQPDIKKFDAAQNMRPAKLITCRGRVYESSRRCTSMVAIENMAAAGSTKAPHSECCLEGTFLTCERHRRMLPLYGLFESKGHVIKKIGS